MAVKKEEVLKNFLRIEAELGLLSGDRIKEWNEYLTYLRVHGDITASQFTKWKFKPYL